MKRNKFTDSQIAFILRQAEEGTPVEEVRRTGIYVLRRLKSWVKPEIRALRPERGS